MRLAGRYLNAAQQLGDAAILSSLRHRQLNRSTGQLTYKNIQELANSARNDIKQGMKEGYIKQQFITPKMLLETADSMIDNVITLQDEMIGIPLD
jgi:hypothetical protein